MKRNRELKQAARAALTGKWGWAVLPGLIYFAVSGVLTAPQMLSSASTGFLDAGFITPALGLAAIGASLLGTGVTVAASLFGLEPMKVGFCNSLKVLYKDADKNTVQNMFKFGFGKERYWRNVLGMFLVGLFTGLWALLFIIPGIIKSYAYALTPYILVDNPELGPNQARLKSIEMMRGYKWKLFGLDLSFIGWILLCILSLGIGFIWIGPYIRTARAAFYYDLVENSSAAA